MEFLNKLGKKASETYKEAAEKTSKIAKETKLKMKINENKSKINEIYKEIGKKVYQKHTAEEELCIKSDLEEECAKIDILSVEIDTYHKEILEIANKKACINCKEHMNNDARFCPKCGTEQPIEENQAMEVEVIDENENKEDETIKEENEENKNEYNFENSEGENQTGEDSNTSVQTEENEDSNQE